MDVDSASSSSAIYSRDQIFRKVDEIQAECHSILRRYGLSLPDPATDPLPPTAQVERSIPSSLDTLFPKLAHPPPPIRVGFSSDTRMTQLALALKADEEEVEEGEISDEEGGVLTAELEEVSQVGDVPYQAQEYGPALPLPIGDIDLSKLYISYLHHSTTREQLEDHYRRFGTILDARVRSSSRINTFGFVTFAHSAEAQIALHQTHGRPLGGSVVTVGYARAIQAPSAAFVPGTSSSRTSNNPPPSASIPHARVPIHFL